MRSFVAILAVFSCSHPGLAADRPNVLFIAVDDLRPELACYGAKHIQSPNIDALAARGTLFQRAYCQQAVCSPSRTSLLTGLRPDSTKVYDLVTHFRTHVPDVVTLPQQFKQHGYTTAAFGKLYHGGYDDEPSWSEPTVFPRRPAWLEPDNQKIIEQRQAAVKKTGKKKADRKAARGPAYEGADVADNAYGDGHLAELAIDRMRTLAADDKPFFLAVGFLKPHLPFIAPQKYWNLYDPQTIKLAANPFHPHGAPPFALTSSGEIRAYHGIPQSGPIGDEQARMLKHAYYACVSYTDANIGKLVAEVEKLKLREKTIIVLWGDHGWKLGEHGEWCKHSNVENDTNVVLIVSAPGQKAAGKTTAALVEFVDIYPSLCDLAGLPKPDHLEGTSFAPLLDEPTKSWKTAAFSQYPRSQDGQQLMGYSLRNDRYRYTRWVDRKDRTKIVAEELYDHQSDPAENENRAGDAAHASALAACRKLADAGWKPVQIRP
ncbi:MAG TPA: sulfatase [Planctomycetaceae bacterium]|nr:sulfatase [Planctomycetaceae bacterium]